MNNTINKLTLPDGGNYSIVSINDNNFKASINNLENEINFIIQKMSTHISLVHNCANCGATLNIEENKPVFHCKYCGSTYLVGTAQIYSNY